MPTNYLKLRETYYNSRNSKTEMSEIVTIVNLDRVLTISYSKIKEIEGDYVCVTFENGSIVGMVVN